ncbi:MAG TPA: ACP phosphodiesterase [Puia sp.]|nr:ACP phosphodiesterase [Puia sp.]
MNYLAHAYLSFGIPEIVVGNLISDFVKGKKKLDYPPGIRRGIALHRAIDEYTDGHAVTRRAKVVFRAEYGLYAGAIVDVVYDHFVANDDAFFPTDAELRGFALKTYQQAAVWQAFFPERFLRMFHFMRTQDWLYHYRYKEGIFNSLAGLARRAAYMKDPAAACRLFEEHYTELGECYREFFPSLKEFAFATLERLSGEEK